ncbi:MAG: LapA family protein [Candidatus Caldatribacteriota bacterium]|nr:LapA family protein [Candidatus Caldatribacteriota bacterium]
MQLQLILAIIIAIIAVIFALQNAATITVGFLMWKFESSLALVLLVAIALGIIISLLVSVPSRIKEIKVISSQKRKIKELESDLQEKSEKSDSEREGKIKSEDTEMPLK